MKTSDRIKVRACQIIHKEHPDWGTFGVMEDFGTYYEIQGDAGRRTISKREVDALWDVV